MKKKKGKKVMKYFVPKMKNMELHVENLDGGASNGWAKPVKKADNLSATNSN